MKRDRCDVLKRAYWRALILYADLAETTYQLAESARGPTDASRLKASCEDEDRALLAYQKTRNDFIAEVLAANFEKGARVSSWHNALKA